MFLGGAIRPPSKDPTGERSQDLENLVGNLMITEHQATRIRERLADHCTSTYTSNKTESKFMFKSQKGDWFEVHVEVNKLNEDKKEEPVKHEPVEVAVLDLDDDHEPV